MDSSTTSKKLEAHECINYRPRVKRTQEGRVKTKDNLDLYLEEVLSITNVNRRKVSDVKIRGRGSTILCVVCYFMRKLVSTLKERK